jgi:hypothetical protein
MNKKLLELLNDHFSDGSLWHDSDETYRMRALVKAELAKPDPEPVAWAFQSDVGLLMSKDKEWCKKTHEQAGTGPIYPLYTHPLKREPLSDDDIKAISFMVPSSLGSINFARAIEKAHGIGE